MLAEFRGTRRARLRWIHRFLWGVKPFLTHLEWHLDFVGVEQVSGVQNASFQSLGSRSFTVGFVRTFKKLNLHFKFQTYRSICLTSTCTVFSNRERRRRGQCPGQFDNGSRRQVETGCTGPASNRNTRSREYFVLFNRLECNSHNYPRSNSYFLIEFMGQR